MGADSPELAPDLNNLGAMYELGTERQKAEALFLRAISIDEKAMGPESPDVATDLNNLGLLYVLSKRYQEAANIYQRALNIRVKALDPTDPAIAQTMQGYVLALRGLGREIEAKQMEERAEAISSSQSVQGK